MSLVVDDIFKSEISKEDLKKVIEIPKDSRSQGIKGIISFIDSDPIFKNFNKYFDVEIFKYAFIGNRILKRSIGKTEKCKGMLILSAVKNTNYPISNAEGLCVELKNCQIETKEKEKKIFIQFV